MTKKNIANYSKKELVEYQNDLDHLISLYDRNVFMRPHLTRKYQLIRKSEEVVKLLKTF
jgi:hypothetical protein